MLVMDDMNHPHDLPRDLNALVALDALLATRSVTVAAKRLGVTQSAMSHTLKRLRSSFDDPLLVPGRSGLLPTARATELAGPLRRALEALGTALAPTEPFVPALSARTFVVATVDYGEIRALPLALARLRAEAPGIRLVIERPRPDLAARLESGAVDLAVGATLPTLAGLRRASLEKEGFVVLARAGHPRFPRKLTLASYAALPHLLIAPHGAPGGPVDDALAARGLTRDVVLRIPQFTSAPFLVASSDLVLTAPMGLAVWARDFLSLQERPLPLRLPAVAAQMTWHERSHTDPAHVWFRRLVQGIA